MARGGGGGALLPLRTTPSAGARGLGVSYVTEGAAPNSRQRAGLQLLFREMKKTAPYPQDEGGCGAAAFTGGVYSAAKRVLPLCLSQR